MSCPVDVDMDLKNPLIKLGSQDVTIGKPYDFPSYGWDNEYGNMTLRYVCIHTHAFTHACMHTKHNVLKKIMLYYCHWHKKLRNLKTKL